MDILIKVKGNMLIGLFSLLAFSMYAQSNKLEINKLTRDFYIYTTYRGEKEMRFPANGMYVVTDAGVVLFDTPWDTTQFQPLLDAIAARHHKEVILCIATHYHGDRTAGLQYYRDKKIRTYTTKLTDYLAKTNREKRAEFLMPLDTTFIIGQYTFHTHYPGIGHTADNIIVSFDKEKILYAGCFAKSFEAQTLGYIEDANIAEWKKSIQHVIAKYPKPNSVIPGHQEWYNAKCLDHTLELIEKELSKLPTIPLKASDSARKIVK
jgi:metallo-beta-lactamase class B